MIDFKNMSDQELLDLIDSEDYLKSPVIKEMQVLAKTDLEFADRLLDLKIKNKSTLTFTTMKGESHSPDQPVTQWVIDDLNKLLNSLPLNAPNRDTVNKFNMNLLSYLYFPMIELLEKALSDDNVPENIKEELKLKLIKYKQWQKNQ